MARGPAPGVCQRCGGPSSRRSPCKPCRNEYLRKRYAAKPHLQAEAKRRYCAKHPDRIRDQRAAYKAKEAVRFRERLRANLSRCKVGGYGQGVLDFTEFDYQRLVAKQYGRCALCARDDRQLTIDHIVPLSRGGTNKAENLQLLCRSCNTKKMTRAFCGIAHLTRPGTYLNG